MRLGYLGPEGTFSEAALRATAPADAQAIGYPTIHDVTEAVAAGDVDRGLVPIENSLEGSVTVTLDALTRDGSPLQIVGETVLAIEQCLIARAGVTLGEIVAVVSHPQALGQCAGYLRRELPEAQLHAAGSTAEAARDVVARSEPWAAIGPRRAAELAGAVVLAESIQDDAGNETRFVWLATDADVAPFGPTDGSFRTSILFAGEGDETPGWLVRCLTELSSRAVNLTKIESRPRRGRLGHYLFLADLDGPVSDPTIAQAIDGLRVHCQELRVLGSYPAARVGADESVH
jgi:prephenate dehydratase